MDFNLFAVVQDVPIQIGKILEAETFVESVTDDRGSRSHGFISDDEADHRKQRKVLLGYEIGHDEVDDERAGDCDGESEDKKEETKHEFGYIEAY